MPKKKLKGIVVSNKMQKTVVVEVDTSRRHPMYNKMIKRSKKIKARDEMGTTEGTMVVIEESKPYSKQVSWKVVEKLEDKK